LKAVKNNNAALLLGAKSNKRTKPAPQSTYERALISDHCSRAGGNIHTQEDHKQSPPQALSEVTDPSGDKGSSGRREHQQWEYPSHLSIGEEGKDQSKAL
jgi:hypothetical protein